MTTRGSVLLAFFWLSYLCEAAIGLDGINAGEIDAFLVLNASGLSAQRQVALVEAFGSAEGALGASDDDVLGVEGLNQGHLGKLRTAQTEVDLEGVRRKCEELEVRPVPYTCAEYPALLNDTEGAPALLFVQGTLERRDELSVGVVGTRKCSSYGLTMARRLAGDLATRGFTIVSGMALGIDGEAHRAALEAGGRTVAVMASGADITYPSAHKQLRARIAGSGAVATEFGLGTPPTRERFPARNRLISGMSLGVVVVEAPAKSGALITARLAGEQGREVFAVPGDVTRSESRGCHALVKDGARLVEFAEDVVEGLGILLRAVPERQQIPTADLPSEEKAIVEALSHQPRHVDAVVSDCGLPPAKVTAGLMVLEMKGLVRRLPGGTFVRL